MDFWVNAEPSLRVFGRCKSANREGSLVARMCNSPTPVSFVCIVVSAHQLNHNLCKCAPWDCSMQW